MASIKDIRAFYSFRPSISIWTSHTKTKSFATKTIQEAWYGGPPFTDGVFFLIQMKFVAIHIKVKWWVFRGSK